MSDPTREQIASVVWQGVGRLVADVQDECVEVDDRVALHRSEQLTSDLVALLASSPSCPYVSSTDEGTSHCTLAQSGADELAAARAATHEVIKLGHQLRQAAGLVLTYWEDCTPPADLANYMADAFARLNDALTGTPAPGPTHGNRPEASS